jgi:hypothetical protein
MINPTIPGHVGEKEANMRRQLIHPTLSTRLFRVAVTLGAAMLLAGLAAVPASAHAEKQVGRYAFVVGFGDEPAYAGQPNSLQVLITRDGKPATDAPPGASPCSWPSTSRHRPPPDRTDPECRPSASRPL